MEEETGLLNEAELAIDKIGKDSKVQLKIRVVAGRRGAYVDEERKFVDHELMWSGERFSQYERELLNRTFLLAKDMVFRKK